MQKLTYLIPINNDLFDVANRLKSINANYRVYYNRVANRFEVHCLTQQGSTLAFVVPYDSLDARTVQLANQSRVEHSSRIFEEMEKHNTLLEKHQAAAAVDNAMSAVEKALSLGAIRK